MDSSAHNQATRQVLTLKKALPPQPQWIAVEGIPALRIPDQPYFALAGDGTRESSVFMIMKDTNDPKLSEYICQVKRREVRGWLIRQSLNGTPCA